MVPTLKPIAGLPLRVVPADRQKVPDHVESARPPVFVALGVDSKMNTKLFIGNLDFTTSSSDLERVFGEHGRVISALVISDRETGNSRGFGFVEYASGDDAERAIGSLNGSDLRGRAMQVSVARERRADARR